MTFWFICPAQYAPSFAHTDPVQKCERELHVCLCTEAFVLHLEIIWKYTSVKWSINLLCGGCDETNKCFDVLFASLVCHGRSNKMKEMVGGCCVCSDERGWPDNPLVYCDGASCTVAVHQGDYTQLSLCSFLIGKCLFLSILFFFSFIIIMRCFYFPMYTS